MLCVFVLAFAPYYTTARVIKYKQFSSPIFLFVSVSLVCQNQHQLPLYSRLQEAERAMVISAHPLASEAGLAMLRKRGNAVDAAVATTFAISVLEPFSAGIGGGGFYCCTNQIGNEGTGRTRSFTYAEYVPE